MRNQLLRALQAGVLSPDDLTESEVAELTGAPGTPQPRFDVPEVPMNSMRAESGPDAGKVTSLNFRDAAGRQAPGGMTWDALNASLAQQPPPEGLSWDDLRARTGGGQKRQMRVVGAGNGSTVDLSPEDAGPVALDYTRPPVDVPGVGKAYYSKDGRGAYVMGPDGQPATKVILGYDDAGTLARNKALQETRAKEATIGQTQAATDHSREQIEASKAARNQKEGILGAGVPQSLLEKQYGKAPDGKRWTLAGTLEDVPGGGKALTESQGKAAGLATRAQAAHDILLGLEGAGVKTPSLIKQAAEGVPLVGGALGAAVNTLNIPSASQRKVEQAQRDFVNAALRVESGASISQSEFDNARKQYFPQPGDDPATILQKQQGREREIQSLGIQSGRGAVNIDKVKTGGNAEHAKAIAEAKQAIANGAPRARVLQRLQVLGISTAEV